MSDIVRIKVENLFLDEENYRIGSAGDQRDAIKKIIEHQGDKLYVLAEDIVLNGINPMDNLLVVKRKDSENGYTVIEGNRRITAIKILNNPKLADNTSIARRIQTLAKTDLTRVPLELPCVVFSNKNDSSKWVQRKHDIGLKGKGTESWNPIDIRRARRALGEDTLDLSVYELIKSNTHPELKDEEYKITNLERIIKDKLVQRILGLNKFIKDNIIALDKESELYKILEYVVMDVSGKKFTVNRIRNQEQRELYIKDVIHEISGKAMTSFAENDGIKNTDKDSASDKAECMEVVKSKEDSLSESEKIASGAQDKKIEIETKSVVEENSKSESSNPKDSGENKSSNVNQRTPNRKILIPDDFKVNIDKTRAKYIYDELKFIWVTKCPNAVAVLFRVFLELSLERYLEEKCAKGVLQAVKDKSIKEKLTKVLDDMQNRNSIDKKLKSQISLAISNSDSILSTSTFNSYVHSSIHLPIPTELNLAWDRLEPFFALLWE